MGRPLQIETALPFHLRCSGITSEFYLSLSLHFIRFILVTTFQPIPIFIAVLTPFDSSHSHHHTQHIVTVPRHYYHLFQFKYSSSRYLFDAFFSVLICAMQTIQNSLFIVSNGVHLKLISFIGLNVIKLFQLIWWIAGIYRGPILRILIFWEKSHGWWTFEMDGKRAQTRTHALSTHNELVCSFQKSLTFIGKCCCWWNVALADCFTMEFS